ncbi:unnamed protein product, partial [Mesorhabditis belari]|uniref:Uncharacterized protein n=1 Tax=Mesorhabditis belari TaxID=2138241 RepID=A0AAF3EFU2_9BILA
MAFSSSRSRPSLQSSTDSAASKDENLTASALSSAHRAGGRAPFNSTSFLIQDAQEREAAQERKVARRAPLTRRASKTWSQIERDVKDEIERMDLDHFVALEKETEIEQTAGKTRDELVSLLIDTKMKYQKTLEDLEKIQQENHCLKSMLFPDL